MTRTKPNPSTPPAGARRASVVVLGSVGSPPPVTGGGGGGGGGAAKSVRASASRSTRGRPLVPTTTSLIVWVAAEAQLLAHTWTRYAVAALYVSTVASSLPST